MNIIYLFTKQPRAKLLTTLRENTFFKHRWQGKTASNQYLLCFCPHEIFYHFKDKFIWSPFTTQSRLLTTPKKKPFENIVGKGENAGKQHFLLFPQCFLPFPKDISLCMLHLFCRLQMLSILDQSKNLFFVVFK